MPLPGSGYHNGSHFPGDRHNGDRDRWEDMREERRLREHYWGCYPFYPFTYDPYPFYHHPFFHRHNFAFVYAGCEIPDYEIYPVYPVDPTPLPIGSNWERAEVDLDEVVTDGTLDLTDLMNLNNYQGYAVESVEVYTDMGQWDQRTLQLVFDQNQVVDTVTSQSGVITLRPNVRGRRIGMNLQDVSLNVFGTANIDHIVVYMKRTPSVMADEILLDVPVVIDSVDVTDVDVYEQLNLAKYAGYRVLSFEIEGLASANESMQAQLFVNTYNMGAAYLPNYSSRQGFYINPGNSVIGKGMDSMHVYMNGSGEMRAMHVRLLKY